MWEPTPQNIENLRSNNLFKMFGFTKKGEACKYAARVTISGTELFETIIGSQHVGCLYFRKEHIWAPEHLSPSDDEINALGGDDNTIETKRMQEGFFRKVTQGFKERKLLIFHLFTFGSDKWHIVYFNEKDSDVKNNNHWKHGPHIHFINHLWKIDLEALWNSFPKLPANGLHIKYDDSL